MAAAFAVSRGNVIFFFYKEISLRSGGRILGI